MKKLIFLLLCTVSIYGQTTTGQEQEFDYGIKNNSAQTITTPPYLTTTGMDGTQGKIPSALIEKTDNKQNSLAIDGTGTKYPTVDAVNTGLALKALDSNVVHKTENETVAGVKTFSSNIKLQTGILELNNSDDDGYGSILFNNNRFLFRDKTDKIQFLIEEENFSTYKTSSVLGRFVNSNLTATRNYGLPDASGTIALVSQTVTNGVLTSSPSQDAVYDFVTANAVTLGTTNGLSLSGQQISLGLSSTSTIGALSSTDWNVFNNKENAFSKNTAFNKNFGTAAGTVIEGNDSRILNGQTAFGWGNHASAGYALTTGSNINQSSFRTALGLGSNAYSSTSYLPLTGGTLSGSVTASNGTLIGGTLTSGYIPKATGVNSLGNSLIYDNGTNVGIGTTAPTEKITLDGNIQFASAANLNMSYGKIMSRYGGNELFQVSGEIDFVRNEDITGNGADIVLRNNDGTNGLLERMRIIGNGNVGIGNSAPSEKLEVTGTVKATNYTGSATLTGTPTAPTAAVGTTGNQIATLDYVLANSGANSGATSGTYTPTVTNGLNVTSSTLATSAYTKIGNIVTVTVTLYISVEAAVSPTMVTISLPFNRSTSSNDFVCGSGLVIPNSSSSFTNAFFKLKNNTTEVGLFFYPVIPGGNTLTGTFRYSI